MVILTQSITLLATSKQLLTYAGVVTLPAPLVTPPAPGIQYENTDLFIFNITVAAGYTFADVAYLVKGAGPYYATSLSIQLPTNQTLKPGDVQVYIYANDARTDSEKLLNQATYTYQAPAKTTPVAPVYAGDDSADTLSLSHPLGLAELLESTDGGTTFAAATTLYRSIGDLDVAAGKYRAKTRATSTRNESPAASSPAFSKKVVTQQPLPYPEDGLVQYADTSFGPLSQAVVLDGNGKLTAFRNQVRTATGSDLVADTPLDFVPNADGTPAIQMQTGGMSSTLRQTRTAPFTLVTVMRNQPAAHIDYQIIVNLDSGAPDTWARVFIKNDTGVLIGHSNTYTDVSGQFPPNQYAVLVVSSAGPSRSQGGVAIHSAAGLAGGNVDSFFTGKQFLRVQAGQGNYQLKLFMLYNRELTDAEASTIVSTARSRFNF